MPWFGETLMAAYWQMCKKIAHYFHYPAANG